MKLLQDVQSNRQQADQELAVLQEQEKQLRRDVKLSTERIQTEQEAISSLKGKQDQVAKLADTETLTIQEITTQLKSTTAEKAGFDADLRQLRERKKQTEQNRAVQETEQNEKNKNLQKLWSEHAKLETNAGRYEIAIDHHLAHLSEEYGLSFEAAKQDHQLTQEPEEAARQVKQAEKRHRRAGSDQYGCDRGI